MAVAVERVISAKRHYVAAGQNVGQAALHHSPCVEIMHVEKRGQRDAKHFFTVQLLRERLNGEFLENRINRAIMINTNGIRLAHDEELVERIATMRDRVEIYHANQ